MLHKITVEINDAGLGNYTDNALAMLWHVAQANPVPHGDPVAGQLVERIGREIIRRWLRATPELWYHQGRDCYWSELRKLATYKPGPGEVGSAEWYAGVWEPRPPTPQAAAGGAAETSAGEAER